MIIEGAAVSEPAIEKARAMACQALAMLDALETDNAQVAATYLSMAIDMIG